MDAKAMNKNVLNLDSLYGQDQPVIVIHNGREFELRRLDSLSPKQFMEWDELGKQIEKLSLNYDAKNDPEFAAAMEVESAVTKALGLICPELAEAQPPLVFSAMMKVINFYIEQTVPPEPPKVEGEGEGEDGTEKKV